MKKIAVLIIDELVDLTTVTGVKEIFSRTNGFLVSTGKNKAFEVKLVGLQTDNALDKNLSLRTDTVISEYKYPDLIIIPSSTDPLSLATPSPEVVHWLYSAYSNGSEIATLCTGSLLLASTGLLNGRTCSTHWAMANEFQSRFPKVNLVSEKVITDDGRIYTSGGAYSFLNLIVYLIEKYGGRQASIWAAKMFGIDMGRDSQSQFIIFQGQKQHQDNEILRVQEFIETNCHQKIVIGQLATMVNIDNRNFIRRFKRATYNTPLEYVQKVKMEVAKRKLETTNMSIGEIKYSLAWSDDNTFRKVFKRHTNMTPSEYKSKYSVLHA